MSNFEESRKTKEERKKRDKVRKEKLAGFFFNLAQLAFASMVIGWITPLQSPSSNFGSWLVLVGGIMFTSIFAIIGNKILK